MGRKKDLLKNKGKGTDRKKYKNRRKSKLLSNKSTSSKGIKTNKQQRNKYKKRDNERKNDVTGLTLIEEIM